MLCITRAVGESVRIGDDVFVAVIRNYKGGETKLGIVAPREMEIARNEIDDRPHPFHGQVPPKERRSVD